MNAPANRMKLWCFLYGQPVVTAFLTLTDIYHTRYQNLADNKCIETTR